MSYGTTFEHTGGATTKSTPAKNTLPRSGPVKKIDGQTRIGTVEHGKASTYRTPTVNAHRNP